MTTNSSFVPAERIESLILLVRGEKVMLDTDLKRFPPDFIFELTDREVAALRSQDATSKRSGRGGRRYLPLVFTEQGVAMLSSVLKSECAVEVNIIIMRAFVKLRQLLATHADLARKLDALERKYDAQVRVVFDAIRELMKPPESESRPVGFRKDCMRQARAANSLS